MHVIIDYDVGNLGSVIQSFKKAGFDLRVSRDVAVIKSADSLILPGVGAFKGAMDALRNTGLIPYIYEHVKQGKPLLGICLGMQLLYESSDEFGLHEGLGLLPGKITRFQTELNVPHMGWNQLTFNQPNHPILKYIEPNDYVYFVHSYLAITTDDTIIAQTNYDGKVPAITGVNAVYGMQFHPEKSGPVGAKLLRAYKEMIT